MSNVIKHKRGTTNPSASDLVVGELAINTNDGGVFTKTDGGSVVEVGASTGGSTGALHYLHVKGSGTQSLINAFRRLEFGTTVTTSDSSDFTVTSTGTITVINAGKYFVQYSATGDQVVGTNTANRIIISTQIEVNAVAVDGTQADVYSRNTNDGDFTLVGGSILTLAANDTVRVTAKIDNANLAADIDLSISGLSMFTLAEQGPAGADGADGADGGTDIVLDTTPQLGGDLASNSHNILVADDDRLKFGAGTDLEIFHNTANNNSVIKENGSGSLVLAGDNVIIKNTNGTENKAQFNTDAAVKLYHNNIEKFETTSSGATVTGTCVATEFSGSGASLTGVVKTDATGISGASTVSNIVTISQADYDAISSPDASTIYYITS